MIPLTLSLMFALAQDLSLEDLIRQLESDSPQQREEAERSLKAKGSAALPWLEKACKHKDPEVAARARRLRDLVGIVDREKLTQEILGDIPGLDEKILAEGKGAWISTLIAMVGRNQKLKDATWAALGVHAAKSATTIEEREKICLALAAHPIVAAAPEIYPYFTASNEEGRNTRPLLSSAVDALRRMGAKAELYRVVAEYGTYKLNRRKLEEGAFEQIDLNVVHEAFMALKDLRATEEIRKIVNLKNCFSGGDAAAALGELEVREAIPDLLEGLSNENPWVRHHAARALGRMGVREAKPKLVALLEDPFGPPRRGALEALGQLGAREEIPAMIPLVGDSRSWVQVAAMRALAALGATEAIPAVKETISHPDPAVRAIGVETLLALQGRSAVPAALLALKDSVPEVRLYAAAALCRAGSLKGVPAIIRLVEKPVSGCLNVGDQMSGGGLEFAPQPLFLLNRARSPDLWKRLSSASLSQEASGRAGRDLPRFAKELGLSLEFSPKLSSEAKSLLEKEYWYAPLPKGCHLEQPLEALCRNCGVAIVLDGAAFRVLTVEEAVSEWKHWWLEKAADDDDRAEREAMKAELERAALPAEQRAALEEKERLEQKRARREARRKEIEGVITPGLRKREGLEERLLEGDDSTWTQAALELAGKPLKDLGLSEADASVLVIQGLRAAAKVEDKVKILGVAGVIRGKAVMREVREFLKTPEASIRAAAVRALDPREDSAEVMVRARDPSPEVRYAVANAFWTHPSPEAMEVLKELSQDADARVSDTATYGLQFNGGPELIPHMIGQLERSKRNYGAAHAALSFLSRQGAREAIPDIILLLDEPQQRSLAQALQALQDLGAREAIPRILERLHSEPGLVGATAPLLEAFGVREAIPELRRRLEEEDGFSAQRFAPILARMGDRESLPAIRKLLRHEYGPVRAMACDALSLLEGPKAREEILEAFKDQETTPAEALVRLGLREAIPELRRRLKRANSPQLLQALVDLDAREALPDIFEWVAKLPNSYMFIDALRAAVRAFPAESIPALRTLAAHDPLQGAALLCEAGSIDGVALLVEKEWPAFSLNAIRQPDVWRRLRETRIDETLYGNGPELLGRVARAADMAMEDLPLGAAGAKAWAGRHLFIPKRSRPARLLEVLDRFQDERWAFVLEKDRIRIVPKTDAISLWKNWWSEARRK